MRRMVSRRHVLISTAAVGAAAALPVSGVRATPAGAHQCFQHGVASGDPLPTTVILWTRVTPTAEAAPGSRSGGDVPVTWQVALDEDFSTVVREGTAWATAARDHTVHVDPFGLAPDTAYFYRFLVQATASPVGRTRTTPADDASPGALRLAVASCANWESGYFSAYRDIAERARAGEIDVVVHLGDYLYEYATGEYAGKSGVTRPFDPPWEIVTDRDYRIRHGQYRRDPDLQAAHAAAPWVVTWDDHELANNAHADGAEGHDHTDGDWGTRRAAAMGAYLDWLPVRATSPVAGGRLYRSLKFGRLAELHMLDLRTYRSAPAAFRAANLEASMMGQEQFEWLSNKLSTSDTTWSLVGNSVMISPLDLFNLDPRASAPLSDLTGASSNGQLNPELNPDQWDGYPADRERLLSQIADARADASTVFLTGDIHSEWAARVSFGGRVIGTELVCSSVTAPNVDDLLKLPRAHPVSLHAQDFVMANNPHFRHVNLDDHGYLIVNLQTDLLRASWMRVDDVERADSSVHVGEVRQFGRAGAQEYG